MQHPGPILGVALAAGLSLQGFCSCPDNHVTDAAVDPDLVAPFVVTTSLGDCQPGLVASGVSVIGAIDITFSEPMDPAFVTTDTVLLVEGEVDDTFLSDVNSPPLIDSRQDRVIPLTLALWTNGAGVTLTPDVPMLPEALHTLVVSSNARDVSGAPLVDELGLESSFTCPFLTADAASGPPQVALLFPPEDSLSAVPPNLAVFAVVFTEPVNNVTTTSFRILDAFDSPAPGAIIDPPQCAGMMARTCFGFAPSSNLAVSTAHRVLLTSGITDDTAVPLIEASFDFTTAATVDNDPPLIMGLMVLPADVSAVVSWTTDESATTVVRYGVASLGTTASGDPGLSHGVSITGLSPLTSYMFQVESSDLAGNVATMNGMFTTTDPVPEIALTEVYADAFSSPENIAEFVEVYNFSATDTIDLTGWTIDQFDVDPMSWDSLTPDASSMLAPGETALIVGTGYAPGTGEFCSSGAVPPPDCDIDPPAGTKIFRVPGTGVTSSLNNTGEVLSIRNAAGVIVTSLSSVLSFSEGVSLVRSCPDAPDIPASWSSHPASTSSPGTVEACP